MGKLVGRAPRAALAMFALSFAVLGRGYWLDRHGERFAADVWPFTMLAVGILLAVLAAYPTRRAAIVLGSAGAAVLASRTAGILVNIVAGDVYDPEEVDAALARALGLWPMAAALFLYTFAEGIAPWAAAEELYRRSRRRRRER